jgi:hypothetical protein
MRQTKTAKRNNRRKQNKNMETNLVSIPRNLTFKGNIMPQKFITRLKYLSTSTLNNAGFDTASRQFIINGLYDTDPAFVSTSIPGFVELMAIYSRYRVLRAKMSVDFINLDARPTVCCVGMEPSLFAANTKNYPYFSQENQVSRLIAYNLGGAPVRLEMTRNLAALKGDNSTLDDSDYTGGVGSNPVTPLYGTVAISDPSAFAMVNGAYIRNEITYEAEFFGLRNLNV